MPNNNLQHFLIDEKLKFLYCIFNQKQQKMKNIIPLLFLLLPTFLQAQNFEELISDASKFYSEKEYAASGTAYDKAFKLKEGSAMQYFNAACSWSLTGDTIQSMKYLKSSAEKGWKNLKHLKRDKDIEILRKLNGWAEIEKIVSANLAEYEKDFDKPLKEKLEEIYVKDQTLRLMLGEVEEKFGKGEELEFFWSLIIEQDSMNEEEVIRIIEERGWPGTTLVGGKANLSLWLVIQHAPLETQEKYLPLLQESVKKGESSGRHLALLEDRILVRNDKPQKYGSQIVPDKETGKQIVYEIEEPEYVDQRRAAVGLGPLADYVKRWGIEWTVEQKEK